MLARLFVLAATCLALTAPAVRAEEGMWTFDAFPVDRVRAAYGWAPGKAWLDQLQKASVRLEGGCSGSVVSKAGLVLTNHHCIRACIDALSNDRADLSVRGFLATGRQDERICPGMEASILQSATDVTERMKSASDGIPGEQVSSVLATARRAIEREACGNSQTDVCEVVSLYRGGRFMLYRYTRYQDVRLVFAPEFQAAFFGGDPDNFNFPRYAFDLALLRLYGDGSPVRFREPLRLNPEGASEGDLVFTSGHPGSTERLLTVSELEFQRDHYLPWRTEYLAQIRGSLLATSGIGEEEARQVRDAVFAIENAVKVQGGRRQALVQPGFFALKVREEQRLRDALAASPALRSDYGDPFGDMAALAGPRAATWLPYEMLEVRLGAGSTLLTDARTLVRAAAERQKPSNERLPEFADNRLAQIARRLTAETVVHPVLERIELEFWLLKTRELLGADHPAVRALFDGKSASAIASEIVESSRLMDRSVRQKLWNDADALDTSSDPAILLVKRMDEFARLARSEYESRVSGPAAKATGRLAALRFAVFGDAVYPDATFTLRLSYGTVKGWDDPQHGAIGPFTYIEGLLKRATGAFPFNLPPRWSSGAARIEEGTQMNMASTNDIIGGNSGSPLVNRKGQIVGLVFDGNIHSLGGAYGFDETLNRTVSVASPMIVSALRTIYSADVLIDEMLRG